MPDWLLDILKSSPLAAIVGVMWWYERKERLEDKERNRASASAAHQRDNDTKVAMVSVLEVIKDRLSKR